MYNDRVQGPAAEADNCTNHIPNPHFFFVTRSKKGEKNRDARKFFWGALFNKQTANHVKVFTLLRSVKCFHFSPRQIRVIEEQSKTATFYISLLFSSIGNQKIFLVRPLETTKDNHPRAIRFFKKSWIDLLVSFFPSSHHLLCWKEYTAFETENSHKDTREKQETKQRNNYWKGHVEKIGKKRQK